jgi:hypothetical protein
MARGPLAGASGPGKFSKRTDLPSAYYGEGVETAAIKSQMPLSTTAGEADDRGGRPRTALPPVTPLFAPSQRPEEPITTGVKPGDGGGDEVLMMNQMKQQQSLSQTLAQMLPYDTNGEIAALYEQALSRGL